MKKYLLYLLALPLAFILVQLADQREIIHYLGPSKVDTFQGNIIISFKGHRERECKNTMIYRRIIGCGQVNFDPVPAMTPVGELIPPFSFPLSLLTSSYPDLSGRVCMYQVKIIGFCNLSQQLFHFPTITDSPLVSFVAVPKAITWSPEDASNTER